MPDTEVGFTCAVVACVPQLGIPAHSPDRGHKEESATYAHGSRKSPGERIPTIHHGQKAVDSVVCGPCSLAAEQEAQSVEVSMDLWEAGYRIGPGGIAFEGLWLVSLWHVAVDIFEAEVRYAIPLGAEVIPG